MRKFVIVWRSCLVKTLAVCDADADADANADADADAHSGSCN